MTTITPKILGQLKPASGTQGTPVALYSPAAGITAVLNLTVANNSPSASDNYSVAVVPNGSSLSAISFLMQAFAINPLTAERIGQITLNSGDTLFVGSTSGNVIFNALGQEFTP